jgi:hypothetical protein
MRLTVKDVEKVYEKLKRCANQSFLHEDYDSNVKFIKAAARTAYYFNWIYADAELDQQIGRLGGTLVETSRFNAIEGRVVFYDCFGWDRRGLTLQYVRALKSSNLEFLFVYEDRDATKCESIQAELDDYENCEVYEVDLGVSLSERLNSLYQAIAKYRPEKLLMHLTPWAVEAIAVFSVMPSVQKYQINLTDHAFWLGASIVDYSFEFREYGCTVSEQKRGLNRSQILLNPFYPIETEQSFEGFPVSATNKTVIFSGASYYKVYGRDYKYFRLVKKILDENPDVVICFAGEGEAGPLNRFIKKNHFEERFLLIGNRKDINEVFKNCDIYLATYPLTGGLMAQLAAVYGKPILAYSSDDLACNYVEGIVCRNNKFKVTFQEDKEFFTEAENLIRNLDYRNSKGELLKQSLTNKTQFDANFHDLFVQADIGERYSIEKINYKKFTELYLDVENNYQSPFKRSILKTFRFKSILLFPLLTIKVVLMLCKQKLMERP